MDRQATQDTSLTSSEALHKKTLTLYKELKKTVDSVASAVDQSQDTRSFTGGLNGDQHSPLVFLSPRSGAPPNDFSIGSWDILLDHFDDQLQFLALLCKEQASVSHNLQTSLRQEVALRKILSQEQHSTNEGIQLKEASGFLSEVISHPIVERVTSHELPALEDAYHGWRAQAQESKSSNPIDQLHHLHEITEQYRCMTMKLANEMIGHHKRYEQAVTELDQTRSELLDKIETLNEVRLENDSMLQETSHTKSVLTEVIRALHHSYEEKMALEMELLENENTLKSGRDSNLRGFDGQKHFPTPNLKNEESFCEVLVKNLMFENARFRVQNYFYQQENDRMNRKLNRLLKLIKTSSNLSLYEKAGDITPRGGPTANSQAQATLQGQASLISSVNIDALVEDDADDADVAAIRSQIYRHNETLGEFILSISRRISCDSPINSFTDICTVLNEEMKRIREDQLEYLQLVSEAKLKLQQVLDDSQVLVCGQDQNASPLHIIPNYFSSNGGDDIDQYYKSFRDIHRLACSISVCIRDMGRKQSDLLERCVFLEEQNRGFSEKLNEMEDSVKTHLDLVAYRQEPSSGKNEEIDTVGNNQPIVFPTIANVDYDIAKSSEHPRGYPNLPPISSDITGGDGKAAHSPVSSKSKRVNEGALSGSPSPYLRSPVSINTNQDYESVRSSSQKDDLRYVISQYSTLKTCVEKYLHDLSRSFHPSLKLEPQHHNQHWLSSGTAPTSATHPLPCTKCQETSQMLESSESYFSVLLHDHDPRLALLIAEHTRPMENSDSNTNSEHEVSIDLDLDNQAAYYTENENGHGYGHEGEGSFYHATSTPESMRPSFYKLPYAHQNGSSDSIADTDERGSTPTFESVMYDENRYFQFQLSGSTTTTTTSTTANVTPSANSEAQSHLLMQAQKSPPSPNGASVEALKTSIAHLRQLLSQMEEEKLSAEERAGILSKNLRDTCKENEYLTYKLKATAEEAKDCQAKEQQALQHYKQVSRKNKLLKEYAITLESELVALRSEKYDLEAAIHKLEELSHVRQIESDVAGLELLEVIEKEYRDVTLELHKRLIEAEFKYSNTLRQSIQLCENVESIRQEIIHVRRHQSPPHSTPAPTAATNATTASMATNTPATNTTTASTATNTPATNTTTSATNTTTTTPASLPKETRDAASFTTPQPSPRPTPPASAASTPVRPIRYDVIPLFPTESPTEAVGGVASANGMIVPPLPAVDPQPAQPSPVVVAMDQTPVQSPHEAPRTPPRPLAQPLSQSRSYVSSHPLAAHAEATPSNQAKVPGLIRSASYHPTDTTTTATTTAASISAPASAPTSAPATPTTPSSYMHFHPAFSQQPQQMQHAFHPAQSVVAYPAAHTYQTQHASPYVVPFPHPRAYSSVQMSLPHAQPANSTAHQLPRTLRSFRSFVG